MAVNGKMMPCGKRRGSTAKRRGLPFGAHVNLYSAIQTGQEELPLLSHTMQRSFQCLLYAVRKLRVIGINFYAAQRKNKKSINFQNEIFPVKNIYKQNAFPQTRTTC